MSSGGRPRGRGHHWGVGTGEVGICVVLCARSVGSCQRLLMAHTWAASEIPPSGGPPPTINYPYLATDNLTLQCCWMLKDKHRWTGKKSIFLLIINITKWPRIPSLRSGSVLDSALGFRLWLGCRKMPAASQKRTQNASKSYAWLKPYSKP